MMNSKTAAIQNADRRARIASMCLVMVVVSLGGFVIENVFRFAAGRVLDNRNMYLPFLLGYGLAIAVLYLLFGTPRRLRLCGKNINVPNIWLRLAIYFFISFVCVTVGEYLLGTFVERTCGIVWWNYSNIPLHFSRYTSLPTGTAFAIIITGFMQLFFEPMYRAFASIERRLLYTLALVLMLPIAADFVHSGVRMFVTGELLHVWRIVLPR